MRAPGSLVDRYHKFQFVGSKLLSLQENEKNDGGGGAAGQASARINTHFIHKEGNSSTALAFKYPTLNRPRQQKSNISENIEEFA